MPAGEDLSPSKLPGGFFLSRDSTPHSSALWIGDSRDRRKIRIAYDLVCIMSGMENTR